MTCAELEEVLFQRGTKHHRKCYDIFGDSKLELMNKNCVKQPDRLTGRASGEKIFRLFSWYISLTNIS